MHSAMREATATALVTSLHPASAAVAVLHMTARFPSLYPLFRSLQPAAASELSSSDCLLASLRHSILPSYAVLLAVPQPAAASELSQFDYPPVAAVTLSYPNSAIRDERKDDQGNVPGFGQLHPRTQVGYLCCSGLCISSALTDGGCARSVALASGLTTLGSVFDSPTRMGC